MPVPITAGNILQLKLVGNYGGVVQLNNIFHYVVDSLGSGAGSPATLDTFAAGFKQVVLPSIVGFTTDNVEYTSIEASELDIDTGNLVNGETFLILNGDGQGASGAEPLPPFVNYTFKYLRPSAAFRHGFKRFAGIPEDAQHAGIPESAVITQLNSAAAVLQDLLPAYTVVAGDPDTQITDAAAQPAVLKRFFNGDPLDPINVALITSVTFSKIGSQNSRKYGVGV